MENLEEKKDEAIVEEEQQQPEQPAEKTFTKAEVDEIVAKCLGCEKGKQAP